MTSNHQVVLSRIRQALASARLPAVPTSLPSWDTQPAGDNDWLMETFTRAVTAVHGQVYRPANDQAAIDLILEGVRQLNNAEILAWADSELPIPELGLALRAAGLRVLDAALPADPVARQAKLWELGRAAVGVTGALAGLADTGTLALVNGPGRSRLASLLPPVHVALLRTTTLFPALAAFFAAHPAITQLGSNLVFVTGPSSTADIELTPVWGVHGPKQLRVVLV